MTRRPPRVVDLDAVRASRARLDALVREHPELCSPEAQARAAAWLAGEANNNEEPMPDVETEKVLQKIVRDRDRVLAFEILSGAMTDADREAYFASMTTHVVNTLADEEGDCPLSYFERDAGAVDNDDPVSRFVNGPTFSPRDQATLRAIVLPRLCRQGVVRLAVDADEVMLELIHH